MTETTIRPEPRATALSVIRATALDHVAPRDREDEPSPPNRQMYDSLTSALESWRTAGTLREDSLLLSEWLAVELCGYLFERLGQDSGRFDRWLRDFGDEVCQSQTHPHPAGPTAVEIMSVVADGLGHVLRQPHRDGAAGPDRRAVPALRPARPRRRGRPGDRPHVRVVGRSAAGGTDAP